MHVETSSAYLYRVKEHPNKNTDEAVIALASKYIGQLTLNRSDIVHTIFPIVQLRRNTKNTNVPELSYEGKVYQNQTQT